MSASHWDEVKRRYKFKELNVATWRDPCHSVLPTRVGGVANYQISSDDAGKPYVPKYRYSINTPKPPEPTDDEESSSDDEDKGEGEAVVNVPVTEAEPAVLFETPPEPPFAPACEELPPPPPPGLDIADLLADMEHVSDNVASTSLPVVEDTPDAHVMQEDLPAIGDVLPDDIGEATSVTNEPAAEEIVELKAGPDESSGGQDVLPSEPDPPTTNDAPVEVVEEAEPHAGEPSESLADLSAMPPPAMPDPPNVDDASPLEEPLDLPAQIVFDILPQPLVIPDEVIFDVPPPAPDPPSSEPEPILDATTEPPNEHENIEKKVSFAPGTPEPKPTPRKKKNAVVKKKKKKTAHVPAEELPDDIIAIIDAANDPFLPPLPPQPHEPPSEVEAVTEVTSEQSASQASDEVPSGSPTVIVDVPAAPVDVEADDADVVESGPTSAIEVVAVTAADEPPLPPPSPIIEERAKPAKKVSSKSSAKDKEEGGKKKKGKGKLKTVVNDEPPAGLGIEIPPPPPPPVLELPPDLEAIVEAAAAIEMAGEAGLASTEESDVSADTTDPGIEDPPANDDVKPDTDLLDVNGEAAADVRPDGADQETLESPHDAVPDPTSPVDSGVIVEKEDTCNIADAQALELDSPVADAEDLVVEVLDDPPTIDDENSAGPALIETIGQAEAVAESDLDSLIVSDESPESETSGLELDVTAAVENIVTGDDIVSNEAPQEDSPSEDTTPQSTQPIEETTSGDAEEVDALGHDSHADEDSAVDTTPESKVEGSDEPTGNASAEVVSDTVDRSSGPDGTEVPDFKTSGDIIEESMGGKDLSGLEADTPADEQNHGDELNDTKGEMPTIDSVVAADDTVDNDPPAETTPVQADESKALIADEQPAATEVVIVEEPNPTEVATIVEDQVAVEEPSVAEPIEAEPVVAEPIEAEPVAAEPIVAEDSGPVDTPVEIEPANAEEASDVNKVSEPPAQTVDAPPAPESIEIAAEEPPAEESPEPLQIITEEIAAEEPPAEESLEPLQTITEDIAAVQPAPEAAQSTPEAAETVPEAPPSPTLSKGSAKRRSDGWARPAKKPSESKSKDKGDSKRNSQPGASDSRARSDQHRSRRLSMTSEEEAERRRRRHARKAEETLRVAEEKRKRVQEEDERKIKYDARVAEERRRKSEEEDERMIRRDARRAARRAAIKEAEESARRIAREEAEAEARKEAEVRRRRLERRDSGGGRDRDRPSQRDRDRIREKWSHGRPEPSSTRPRLMKAFSVATSESRTGAGLLVRTSSDNYMARGEDLRRKTTRDSYVRSSPLMEEKVPRVSLDRGSRRSHRSNELQKEQDPPPTSAPKETTDAAPESPSSHRSHRRHRESRGESERDRPHHSRRESERKERRPVLEEKEEKKKKNNLSLMGSFFRAFR